MKTYNPILVLMMISLTLNCQQRSKVHTTEDIYEWIANPKNGLSKTRSVKDITINVKFLPKKLWGKGTASDHSRAEKKTIDRAVLINHKALAFLLTITPHESKIANQDVLYYGVSNFAEYSDRVATLNFRMQNYLSLRLEQQEYIPLSAIFENTYELSKELKIQVIFTIDDLLTKLATVSTIDLTFMDEIFNTGIHHFVFETQSVFNIPEVDLPQLKTNPK